MSQSFNSPSEPPVAIKLGLVGFQSHVKTYNLHKLFYVQDICTK